MITQLSDLFLEGSMAFMSEVVMAVSEWESTSLGVRHWQHRISLRNPVHWDWCISSL